jgi:hypothetical protein
MREVGNGWCCCCCPGWCAQCVDQRMVVFSAVEERDLRSENSDACRVRLGRLRAIVMCIRRELRMSIGPLRLPTPGSRRADNAKDCDAEWWMEEDALSRGRVTRGREGCRALRVAAVTAAIATDGVRLWGATVR